MCEKAFLTVVSWCCAVLHFGKRKQKLFTALQISRSSTVQLSVFRCGFCCGKRLGVYVSFLLSSFDVSSWWIVAFCFQVNTKVIRCSQKAEHCVIVGGLVVDEDEWCMLLTSAVQWCDSVSAAYPTSRCPSLCHKSQFIKTAEWIELVVWHTLHCIGSCSSISRNKGTFLWNLIRNSDFSAFCHGTLACPCGRVINALGRHVQ